MRIILTVLLLAFTTTFAFAADVNEMKKKYERYLKLYKTEKWTPEKCGDDLIACYVSSNGEIYRTTLKVKSYEEAYNIEKQNVDSPFAHLESFPTKTEKLGDYSFVYVGDEGIYVNSDVCYGLFTKNKEGFVEYIYACYF